MHAVDIACRDDEPDDGNGLTGERLMMQIEDGRSGLVHVNGIYRGDKLKCYFVVLAEFLDFVKMLTDPVNNPVMLAPSVQRDPERN